MDLGALEGRGPNFINGSSTEEDRRALLQQSSAAISVGLHGLRPDVSLSQKATGRDDLGYGPSSTTGNMGIGPHALWVQGYDANEQSGSRNGATAFRPVLLRGKWRGPSGQYGVQHRLGNQSLVGDARPRLKERTRVLLKGKTPKSTRAECGLPLNVRVLPSATQEDGHSTVVLRKRTGHASHKLSHVMRGSQARRRTSHSLFQCLGSEGLQEATKDIGWKGSIVRGGRRREAIGTSRSHSIDGRGLPNFGLGRGDPHHSNGEEPDLCTTLRLGKLEPLSRSYITEYAIGALGT